MARLDNGAHESNHLSGDVLSNPNHPDGLYSDRNTRGAFNVRCCWWRLLSFCNALGLVGIGCIAGFLFIQMQYVTYRVQSEHKQIEELKQQVQNQTAGQIQELSQQVENQKDYTILQLAGTFTLLTCLLTLFHMSTHIRNLHEPIVQRKILAILWMSPIYGVTSFLSLLLPKADGYLSIIKDLYEAYVIYTFLSFLIAVLGRGDRDIVVALLAKRADHLEKPTRLLQRYYDPPPETSNEAKANAVLLECQILAMQFVLVRPLTSIMSFLVFTISNDSDYDGVSEKSNGSSSADNYFLSANFIIAMILNVSVFFAFRGLLKFYHAVREDLSWLQLFNKFLAIKGIVFLTFWQGLVISIAVHFVPDKSDESGNNNLNNDPRGQAVAIQNLLICLEMLFFSLAHWCVFPAEEWEPDYRPKQYAKPGLGIKDFAKDVKVIMRRGQQKGARPIPQEPPTLESGDTELGPVDVLVKEDDGDEII